MRNLPRNVQLCMRGGLFNCDRHGANSLISGRFVQNLLLDRGMQSLVEIETPPPAHMPPLNRFIRHDDLFSHLVMLTSHGED